MNKKVDKINLPFYCQFLFVFCDLVTEIVGSLEYNKIKKIKGDDYYVSYYTN